ncbi:MAG TPA: NAD(P)-dependent oxidoreductase [Parvibaculum sp.]
MVFIYKYGLILNYRAYWLTSLEIKPDDPRRRSILSAGFPSGDQMFPIVLDPGALKLVLVGDGDAALKRLALIDAAGLMHVEVYSASPGSDLKERAGSRLKGERPTSEALEAAHLVLIAGLGNDEAEALAGAARKAGRLVNTEDVKALCDFHIPSAVRRGDLLLTVSTGGKSPGLARRLRRHIETLFGPEWAGRLDELADRREGWRRQGMDIPSIGRHTDAYVDEKGWLS